MNSSIQVELDILKEIIVNTLPIEQIYLFGSYAYGNLHKDSDLDLFVVLKDEVQLREIEAAIKIRQAVSEYQTMALDLIVMKGIDTAGQALHPALSAPSAAELRGIDPCFDCARSAMSEQARPRLSLRLSIKKSHYLERKTAPTLERKIAREGILLYAA